ncbi:hypothetical protein PMAYCL1PPCAC_24389, partial [Pristionchus mayeri]
MEGSQSHRSSSFSGVFDPLFDVRSLEHVDDLVNLLPIRCTHIIQIDCGRSVSAAGISDEHSNGAPLLLLHYNYRACIVSEGLRNVDD